MKKVFLDELPRKGSIIDWQSSVGYKVKFIYDEIKGEINIVGYNKKRITIKYLDYDEFEIGIGHFAKCKIGKLLMMHTKEFKINVGDKIKDNKRNLKIIDRKYNCVKCNNSITNLKLYKYHCYKCGNEDWTEESRILRSCGCNVCCTPSKKVLKGYNDIATTDSWMMMLGVSKEDAETHTRTSAEKIIVKCPDCGREKEISICSICNNKSIQCSCGDGVSYPEKFLISLLDQLNIKYKHDNYYIENKRYDFYLPNYNCIIETHGEQHYKQTTRKGNRVRTLQEEQENDKYKQQLAFENGVDKYIVLDCRKSELNWIKNGILQSKLNVMFDLSEVDWLKCEEFATSNRVKEVCNYWKDTNCDLSTLSDKFKLDKHTITRYLKLGTKYNWCNYTTISFKVGRITNKRKKVKIIKNYKTLGVFSCAKELEEKSLELFGVELLANGIRNVCSGHSKTYKGYKFEYVESEEGKIC